MKILKNNYEKYWLIESNGELLGRVRHIEECEKICTLKSHDPSWCHQQIIFLQATKDRKYPPPSLDIYCFQARRRLIKDEDVENGGIYENTKK